MSEDGTFEKLFAAVREHPGAMRGWLLGAAMHPEFAPRGHAPGTAVKEDVTDMAQSQGVQAAQVVLDGKCEDGWAPQHWFTWPGNQFVPEGEQQWFAGQVRGIAGGLDVELGLDEAPIFTDAGVAAFIAGIEADRPDALLLFQFWNSFSAMVAPILDAYDGPVLLYQPVGSNHQLPPARFRGGRRLQYIHSVRNRAALERGLRAVHAWNRMAKGRLLRVSGRAAEASEAREPLFGTTLATVPAAEFNALFDGIPGAGAAAELAAATRALARNVSGLTDEAFVDAARAHLAVGEIRRRHGADAVTIECLFLGHRKPCLSFALNNGELKPCGCENDLDATLTLMLGAALFGRGGFQHNPDFDLEENLYFGAHCTCTTRLHGPGGEPAVDPLLQQHEADHGRDDDHDRRGGDQEYQQTATQPGQIAGIGRAQAVGADIGRGD